MVHSKPEVCPGVAVCTCTSVTLTLSVPDVAYESPQAVVVTGNQSSDAYVTYHPPLEPFTHFMMNARTSELHGAAKLSQPSPVAPELTNVHAAVPHTAPVNVPSRNQNIHQSPMIDGQTV